MNSSSLVRPGTALVVSLLLISTLAADEKFPEQIDRCVSCHGALGTSIFDLWSNHAGQEKACLARQLRAFRDGN